MFSSYVRSAFRNLRKHKGYTFINIIGLAIGISCCLLITLYVYHQLSYDTFLKKADQIYRVKQTSISPTKEESGATTPFQVGPTLAAEFPHLIKNFVRFFNMQEDAETFLNKKGDKLFREHHFFFVDSSFLQVFDVKLVQGNPLHALSNPGSLVMTKKTARKYFGDENPVGRTLNFKGIQDMTVTGIMEPWPENSHIAIDIVASFSTLNQIYHGQEYDKSWFWNPCWVYILLQKDTQLDELRNQLTSYADKYYNPHLPRDESVELDLQPVRDIHLYSNLDQEIQPNNSIFHIYLFSSIAVLILIIACINFMNLATARASERSREVGMRKVFGAGRQQLFKQFMGESFLMSLLSVSLAIIFVLLVLPFFNDFLNQKLVFNPFHDEIVFIGLFILFMVVGFLAGIYPSLYLSGFNPAAILGGVTKGFKGKKFRKGLVIFQFTLSVFLIIGTIIVYIQLDYMQTKELGFDKDQILILPVKQNLTAYEFNMFKQEVLRSPQIKSVTGIQKILGSDKQTYSKYIPAGVSQGEQSSNLTLFVTYDFFRTYNIKIVAGRKFSKEFPTDPQKAVIINEAMLAQLKIASPEEALDNVFYHYDSDNEKEAFTVVGVVENFNYTSIKKEIKPLVIRLVADEISIVRHIQYAAIKIAPGHVPVAIDIVKKAWEKVNYIDPFEFSTEKGELAKIYASEARMSALITLFSMICIFVACLGLFGLSAFTSSSRTKEMGIRKTLGASMVDIVILLSREYIKLVMIANILAWPAMFVTASYWLHDFSYHITLGWNLVIIYLISMILSLVICLLTVSYQSIKVAFINPVDSIRQE